MKNLYLIFGLIFSLLIINCNTEDYKLEKDYKINDQLIVPEGSAININKANNTIQFKLAEGYAFIGENSKGELSKLYEGGTLTCKCTTPADGGCSPFIASGPNGEITGCKMDNCTSCIGTIKASANGITEEITLNKVQIIDKENPISFITELKEFNTLKNPTQKIMSSEFAIAKLQKFLKGFQNKNLSRLKAIKDIDNLKEIGYVLAPINFYGYKIYAPVDKSLKMLSTNLDVNEVMAKYLADDGGKYSCKCNTDESGCILQKQSALIGGAVWCEAGNCGSCTLTTK